MWKASATRSLTSATQHGWIQTALTSVKGKVKLRVFAGMILGRFVFSSVQVQADAQDATFRRV